MQNIFCLYVYVSVATAFILFSLFSSLGAVVAVHHIQTHTQTYKNTTRRTSYDIFSANIIDIH